MLVTLEIDDKTLKSVQRSTGIEGESPAVAKAVELYLDQERRRLLIARAMAGETDYSATNDELEQRSSHDAD